MLIATVETLFLAYSVISASFVSLPWYIAFDIFVGDKKTLSCLNFVSSLLLLNGMSEREYVVILFLSSVVEIDVSFLIVTVFFCPGSRSKKLSLNGKVLLLLSTLTRRAYLSDDTVTFNPSAVSSKTVLSSAFGKRSSFSRQKRTVFC